MAAIDHGAQGDADFPLIFIFSNHETEYLRADPLTQQDCAILYFLDLAKLCMAMVDPNNAT